MKTYHKSTTGKKSFRAFLSKNIYAILLGFTVIAIASIITVSLIVSNRPEGGDNNIVEPPPVVAPVPAYGLPMTNFTLGAEASLGELVYSSTLNQWRTHNGVDFLAEKGSPVLSVIDGTVKEVLALSIDGAVVTIEHANGMVSIYKSLAPEVKVKVGDVVKTGSVIGSVSDSMQPEYKVGSHLHLEMKLNGKLVDPMEFLPEIGNK